MFVFPYISTSFQNAMQALDTGKRVRINGLPDGKFFRADNTGKVHLCSCTLDGLDIIERAGCIVMNVKDMWEVQADLLGSLAISVHRDNLVVGLEQVFTSLEATFPGITREDLDGVVDFEGFDTVQGLGLHRLTDVKTGETLFKIWLTGERE